MSRQVPTSSHCLWSLGGPSQSSTGRSGELQLIKENDSDLKLHISRLPDSTEIQGAQLFKAGNPDGDTRVCLKWYIGEGIKHKDPQDLAVVQAICDMVKIMETLETERILRTSCARDIDYQHNNTKDQTCVHKPETSILGTELNLIAPSDFPLHTKLQYATPKTLPRGYGRAGKQSHQTGTQVQICSSYGTDGMTTDDSEPETYYSSSHTNNRADHSVTAEDGQSWKISRKRPCDNLNCDFKDQLRDPISEKFIQDNCMQKVTQFPYSRNPKPCKDHCGSNQPLVPGGENADGFLFDRMEDCSSETDPADMSSETRSQEENSCEADPADKSSETSSQEEHSFERSLKETLEEVKSVLQSHPTSGLACEIDEPSLPEVDKAFKNSDWKSTDSKRKMQVLISQYRYLHNLYTAEFQSNGGTGMRPDRRAARYLRQRGLLISVPTPEVGPIAGIEVGDIFQCRQELALVGIHRPQQSGIDYITARKSIHIDKHGKKAAVAVSVVSSGGYKDDESDPRGDYLVYSGWGGTVNLSRNQDSFGKHRDQEMVRGNLALKNSCDLYLPVRVIRSFKGLREASSSLSTLYYYAGLYTVKTYYFDTGIAGSKIWKFILMRQKDQLPLPQKFIN